LKSGRQSREGEEKTTPAFVFSNLAVKNFSISQSTLLTPVYRTHLNLTKVWRLFQAGLEVSVSTICTPPPKLIWIYPLIGRRKYWRF